ncbi:MAG: hypothetical protein QOI95_1638 [Acidimicrobiaceae bacterium]
MHQTSWLGGPTWTASSLLPHTGTTLAMQGGPTVVSRGSGQLDVFVWGTDNGVYQFWQ